MTTPPLRYPIGIQTFSKIIEGGYAYIDKTRYIGLLLRQGQYVFLSRPRRFGKSLLVSTLKAFFEGKHELFRGLAIDREENLDRTVSPVLLFDFNTGAYLEEDGLRKRIDSTLARYENLFGITSTDSSASALPLRFENLIRETYRTTGSKVVILVDEYDKPLLCLEEDHPLFEENQKLLKNFYSNLKSMDEYIRFGFLTGVARFSKVSIFSDLNNLQDISLDDRYANLCGITEEELTTVFRPGIEELAQARGEDYDNTLTVLKDYYDGYLFTPGGSRLYNPFSLMQALDSKTIDSFWFDSGTPTFLVEKIKANRIDPMDLNDRICSRRELTQVRIGSRNPIPLMFQTGYLTIDHYDAVRQRYTLRFPNREVEKAFAEELLPLYVKDTMDSSSPFSLFSFQDDLFDGNPDKFMTRLATLFKDLPREDQCESVYRAVTYLLCKLTSTDTHAERHSYKGRSDLEVTTPDYIYILEFKYDRTVREAMSQIHSRDYAGRFMLDTRKVCLIGANFDSSPKNRGLTYEIEWMMR